MCTFTIKCKTLFLISLVMIYPFRISPKWKLLCLGLLKVFVFHFWPLVSHPTGTINDIINWQSAHMLRSCTDIASKPDRPCNEKYSCCKCVSSTLGLLLIFFITVLEEMFRHWLSMQSSSSFNMVSTSTLCCDKKHAWVFTAYATEEEKNATSVSPLLQISEFRISSKQVRTSDV